MALLNRRTPIPVLAHYRDGKRFLREDFRMACCYCQVHEGEFGGWRNFHIDHYRPKSRFPEAEHDYANLLYACSTCNLLKGSSWYDGNPLSEARGFLDPCSHDYAQYFKLDAHEVVSGTIAAAKFMVERLHLNRHHLLELRKLKAFLRRTIDTCMGASTQIEERRKQGNLTEEMEMLGEAIGALSDLAQVYLDQLTTPPYAYQA